MLSFVKKNMFNTDPSTDTQSPDSRTQNSDAFFSLFIFEETEKL